jgi:hypothetical protein
MRYPGFKPLLFKCNLHRYTSEAGLARAAAAAVLANVNLVKIERVKMEGEGGGGGNKRSREGENAPPPNVDVAAEVAGGVEVAEEVAPAEAERRKLARLVAADFIDLTD